VIPIERIISGQWTCTVYVNRYQIYVPWFHIEITQIQYGTFLSFKKGKCTSILFILYIKFCWRRTKRGRIHYTVSLKRQCHEIFDPQVFRQSITP
jgi:hypothetical protein